MSIISSLPYTLTNGQTADATQVMANFNTIISNVNTNAAENGANSSITSLSGLTTPLPESEGGTGSATGATLVPTGAVIPFAGAAAPGGWLLCSGQAVNRTTYAALFALIGITYGAGDGASTFNVPDLRGRTVAGIGNMGGSESNRLSTVIASALGAAGGDQNLQSHSHGVTDPGHVHGITDPSHFHEVQASSNGGTGSVQQTAGPNGSQAPTNSATTGISINSATTGISIQNGGTGGGQNVQPTMELSYIIKT